MVVSPYMARFYLKLLRDIAKWTKAQGGKYAVRPPDIVMKSDMVRGLARTFYGIKDKGHVGLRGWGKNPPYVSAENILKKKAKEVVKKAKKAKRTLNKYPTKNDLDWINHHDAWAESWKMPIEEGRKIRGLLNEWTPKWNRLK